MIFFLALTVIACAVPTVVFAASNTETTETLETVSSYPYTTKTKVKVNLRASRSTRSTLLKKIPADAEITVNAVKGSWAEVQYKKYSGYVKTDYIVLKEVKKVKPTPTPTPVVTLSPEEDAGGYNILQKGAEGREVTSLQEALIELGFLNGQADGKFGASTEKAVIAFQQKNDYPATGIMDANIQAFLYSGQPKNSAGTKTSIRTLSPVAEVSMKKGNKGAAVTELQQKLIELGYLKGTPSGTYDTDTIGAVRSFQKKNGLTSNGKAKTTDEAAVLRVSFFGPFYSDYRVMLLDADYQWALIGSGSAKYLWILSRTPELPKETLDTILAEAQRRGYDTSKLIWVKQK